MKLKLLMQAIFTAYATRSGLVMSGLALQVDKLESVPEVQRTLYKEREGKFHLEVDGIEDTSALKGSLKKERERAEAAEKARKELEAKFDGIDPEKTRQLLSQFEDADEAKLITKGKEGIEAIIAKRMEKALKAAEKQVADAKKEAEKQAGVAKRFMDRVLDNHVRAAAAKAQVHATAVDDAMLRAKSIFSVNEEGEAVQLKEGEVVMGKDGKTPYGIMEWIEGMKESAPHWFPASASGGGSGGGKQGAGGSTMTRKIFESLSPEEKVSKAKEMREGKVKLID